MIRYTRLQVTTLLLERLACKIESEVAQSFLDAGYEDVEWVDDYAWNDRVIEIINEMVEEVC